MYSRCTERASSLVTRPMIVVGDEGFGGDAKISEKSEGSNGYTQSAQKRRRKRRKHTQPPHPTHTKTYTAQDTHRCRSRLPQVKEIAKTGQIQLPVWSPDGRMLAFTVLKAGRASAPIESARILVFRDGGGLEVSASHDPCFDASGSRGGADMPFRVPKVAGYKTVRLKYTSFKGIL